MRKILVVTALFGMLVIFASYAVFTSNQLAERETYITELRLVTDVLTTTVCQQSAQYDADKQRLVSGWHVREMELTGRIFTLETAGTTGVHDLEGIRDELRAAQADLTLPPNRFDETLKLIAQAHDKLQVVFMGDASIQPTLPIPILPADDPLMLGYPTQTAQLYESGEWSYVLFAEDIGTDKECIIGRLMEDHAPVEPGGEDGQPAMVQVETPWGFMYWCGEDRESGRIGWHKSPKDIDLDGLWTPIDDPTVEVE